MKLEADTSIKMAKEEFDPNTNIILETKYWRVVLADNQAYLGRCVIYLNRDAPALSELTKEEITDFLEIIKKLEHSIKKSFNATMFNWACLMNNAYQEENPKPHVHWHLRPRYREKVEFDDVIYEDFEFGKMYDSKRFHGIDQDTARLIISKIKANF